MFSSIRADVLKALHITVETLSVTPSSLMPLCARNDDAGRPLPAASGPVPARASELAEALAHPSSERDVFASGDSAQRRIEAHGEAASRSTR